MRPLLARLIDAGGAIAGAFVFAIFFVMLAATVMRTLGMRTGGSDDVVSWMTAAAAFFGLAHTFKHGDFVRVGLLLEKLPPPARHAFEVGSLAVGTAFTGFLTWSITQYVMDSRTFGDMAGGLVVIPIWIPQSSLVIGSALLCVAVADQFIHVLRGHRPDYVVAVEERHARGDFSEDV
ncbi:MAG: TRAP transporter small permease [Burkholderiales bacterium]|nr:TRAP transporter small permease [Burkholderiales bacterium]